MEPDETLMEKVAQGELSAFTQLFDRHQNSVCRFAFRFVGQWARAEELSQEIFVKLYRGAKGYRPTAKFRTYLFRVAANHCLNELRRGEYQASHLDEDAAAHSPSAERPDEAFQGRRLEAAVQRALGELTERERAAFCLCRFEGLSYKEIAQALSASEAAVKSLIHRATLALAKHLEAEQAELAPVRSRA